MGCDIHMMLDSIHENGIYRWNKNLFTADDDNGEIYYSPVNLWRCRMYDFFALLADVRNYPQKIESLRFDKRWNHEDLDANQMSAVTKKYYEGGKSDWHTPGWFTLDELDDIYCAWQERVMPLCGAFAEERFKTFCGCWIEFTDTLETRIGRPLLRLSKEDLKQYRIFFWFDN